MVNARQTLQLPTSSTSPRDGYSCGFDLCLSSKGHSKWMASKRLSAEGHLLQGSWQRIDPTWKDVGNCKAQTALTHFPPGADADRPGVLRALLSGLGPL